MLEKMEAYFRLGLIVLIICTASAKSSPTISSTESLVVLSTTEVNSKEGISNKNVFKTPASLTVPQIYEMKVDTKVSNRFATTVVTNRVTNLDHQARETTFSAVLPETAYISRFVMEIGGKSYVAYVKEKEEAKKIYDQAVASGSAAAHVAVNARDSNRFTVSTNIEPQSKVVFFLTYEELLQRQNGKYDIVINIHPGQPVKDLNVEINIDESRPLKFVKVPSLRSGNEISKNDEQLDPKADILRINSTFAKVKFNPDIQRQKEFASTLGTKEGDGLAGQFVVQYDVERDTEGGEILISDGYFVHFFAPNDLPPLKKHVVFILDTSGSMGGTRIAQLKTAMKSILAELKKEDTFNIIDFNSAVNVWNVPKVEVQYEKLPLRHWNIGSSKQNISDSKQQTLPDGFSADDDNIKQAQKVLEKLSARGLTDILSALEIGLNLINGTKQGENAKNRQPIIIFLTDGEPTSRETNHDIIISTLTELNVNKVPIFSLSFGDGADRSFLEKISLKNQGFARHIYEGADASLQLQAFYKYISSPLLSNVNFKYVSKSVEKLTKTTFPILFSGSEFVVSGVWNNLDFKVGSEIDPGFAVGGWGHHGPIHLIPKIENAIGSLEKHWAYLTVKQILEKREAAENKTELTKKALDIALKYSFVTPVSSLVVVKPNDTKSEASPENASKEPKASHGFGNRRAGGGFYHYRLKSSSGRSRMPIADYSNSRPSYQPMTHVDRIITTTNFPIPTTDPPAKSINTLDDLKKALPWLENILTANGNLKLVKEGEYELGFNAIITSRPKCPKTPLNFDGECTLLKDCPQILNHLIDEKTFSQFFCPLNKYAGVCCPKLGS